LAEYFGVGIVIKMMGRHEFARLVDMQGPPLILYARQWCATPEDVV